MNSFEYILLCNIPTNREVRKTAPKSTSFNTNIWFVCLVIFFQSIFLSCPCGKAAFMLFMDVKRLY